MKTMNDERKTKLTKRATDIILLLLGFTDTGCLSYSSKKNIIFHHNWKERDNVLLNLCWTSNARVMPSDVS